MSSDEDAFLSVDTAEMDGLHDDIRHMIRWAANEQPRQRQVTLGPSELGHPCQRKLAYGLMAETAPHEARKNITSDPLPSIIGTATHSWLQDAAQRHNEMLGRIRWIAEQRVEVWPGRAGTCDLYDVDTASIVDWKVLGPTNFGKYTKHGPPMWYQKQIQLYGRGFELLGFPVRNVGICFLPRSGQLSRSFLYSEKYDPLVAQQVRERIDDITLLCVDLDLEHHPDRYPYIPKTPGDWCDFCPHWTPRPTNGFECSGPLPGI